MYRIGDGSSAIFPSVTSVLGVLDKPGLVPWAVRATLDALRTDLSQMTSLATPDIAPPTASSVDATVLAAALERAGGAVERVKRSSADFGTRAHAAINAIITGEEHSVAAVASDADIAPVVAGFRRWYANCGIALFPAGDTVVFSRRYQYAGAADAIGRRARDGALVVVDFKTSNSVHATYALQLAAYAHAVREMVADGELRLDGSAWPAPTASATSSEGGGGESFSAPALVGDAGSSLAPGAAAVSSLDVGSFDVFAQPFGGALAGPEGPEAVTPPPSFESAPVPEFAPAPAPARSRSVQSARRSKAGAGVAVADAVVSEALIAGTTASLAAVAAASPPLPLSRGPHAKATRSMATFSRFVTAVGALAATAPPPVESLVVRIDKVTGDVYVSRVADAGSAFAAFKACLLLWHTMSSSNRGRDAGLLVKETRES